jgi:hypothetical protein
LKDFFSNLAMRVLTPEATLQPRLRTRFEAPSAKFEPFRTQSEDVAQLDELTQDITSQPSAHSRGETGVEARTSSRNANVPIRLKGIAKDRTSARSGNEEEANALHATIRSTTSSSARQVEDRSVQEKSLISVVSTNATRSSESQTRSDAKGAVDRSSSRLRSSIDEAGPKPVIPHTRLMERTLVPRSSLETPRPLREAHSGMKTAGTIHISIGRIEVRALVQTPATPHRSAPKPAKPSSMSLDDYLSHRAHGGKR